MKNHSRFGPGLIDQTWSVKFLNQIEGGSYEIGSE